MQTTIQIKPADERGQHVIDWLDAHYHASTFSQRQGMLDTFHDDELRAFIEYELRITLSLLGDMYADADIVNALEELNARSTVGRFYGGSFVLNDDCGCLIGTSVLTAVKPPENGWALHLTRGEKMAERLAERARAAAGDYASRLLGMEILIMPLQPHWTLDEDEKRVMRLIREACEDLLEEVSQQPGVSAK